MVPLVPLASFSDPRRFSPLVFSLPPVWAVSPGRFPLADFDRSSKTLRIPSSDAPGAAEQRGRHVTTS